MLTWKGTVCWDWRYLWCPYLLHVCHGIQEEPVQYNSHNDGTFYNELMFKSIDIINTCILKSDHNNLTSESYIHCTLCILISETFLVIDPTSYYVCLSSILSCLKKYSFLFVSHNYYIQLHELLGRAGSNLVHCIFYVLRCTFIFTLSYIPTTLHYVCSNNVGYTSINILYTGKILPPPFYFRHFHPEDLTWMRI